MTLPASGQIDLAAARNEFKAASGQIAMGELYRSGTYVPPLTANAGIPTSGQIDLNDFYSTTVATDMDTTYTSDWVTVKAGSCTAKVNVKNDGTIDSAGSDVTQNVAISDTWVASSAAPGNWYEVYVSLTSGTSPSGDSLSTWLALTSDRSWYLTADGGIGEITCVLSIKIRHKYNTGSEETTTVTLIAESQ